MGKISKVQIWDRRLKDSVGGGTTCVIQLWCNSAGAQPSTKIFGCLGPWDLKFTNIRSKYPIYLVKIWTLSSYRVIFGKEARFIPLTEVSYFLFGWGDFLKSRDFYPRNRGFFKIRVFLSRRFFSRRSGVFWNLGIFITGIEDFWKSEDFLSPWFFGDGAFSGMGIFFSWDGISHQKATSGHRR